MEIKPMEAPESRISPPAETTPSERYKNKDGGDEDEAEISTPTMIDNFSDNEIKEQEELESPEKPQETGQRENLNSIPPVLETSDEDLVSESPLDLTIQVTRKRKLVEVDLTDDQKVEGILEPVCKRMRPSVISFARRKSRHIEILTNADPAEHFLRALGPHLYNMIYGTYYSPFVGSLHDGRYSSLVEMERQHITRERLPVNEHFRKSLGKKTWMEMQGFR